MIVVDVPDEFMAGRVEELVADMESGTWPAGPVPTPEEYFRERLESVCEDELPVALLGWPVEARALISEDVVVLNGGQERAIVRLALTRHVRRESPSSPVAEAILERMGPPRADGDR